MRFFDVPPAPAPAAGPGPGLGRLDPVLARLAAAQGVPPAAVREPARVVRVPAGTGGGDPETALEDGVRAADGAVDSGADLVVLAGGGDVGPALVVLAALLGRDPVSAVGTTGRAGWAQLVAQVRDGLRAARPHVADPVALLTAAGAGQVAHLTGLVLQSAVRRTPVLLSAAPDALAAAVLARRVAPGVAGWLLAGTSGEGDAAATALGELGLVPVLDLRLDAPAGAELALSLLCAACGLAARGAGA